MATTVLLASNADRKNHPFNTTTNFKNTFSQVLDNSQQKLGIALQSITFNSDFAWFGDQSPILALKIDQIDAFEEPRSLLYIIPLLPSLLSGTGYYFEVKQLEYLRFNTSHIPTISVQFVNYNGRRIRLRRGQPTIIKLACREMSCCEHMLRLSSTMSITHFAGNTQSEFRTILPSRYSFSDGTWQIAMTSINYSRLDAEYYNDNFPNVVMLYADIVQETRVGSSMSRLLKIFPCRQEEGSFGNFYEAQHLEHIKIDCNHASSINLTLRDSAGRLIVFHRDLNFDTIISVLLTKIM